MTSTISGFKIGDRVKIIGKFTLAAKRKRPGIIVDLDEEGVFSICVQFFDELSSIGWYHPKEIEKFPSLEEDDKFLKLFV